MDVLQQGFLQFVSEDNVQKVFAILTKDKLHCYADDPTKSAVRISPIMVFNVGNSCEVESENFKRPKTFSVSSGGTYGEFSCPTNSIKFQWVKCLGDISSAAKSANTANSDIQAGQYSLQSNGTSIEDRLKRLEAMNNNLPISTIQPKAVVKKPVGPTLVRNSSAPPVRSAAAVTPKTMPAWVPNTFGNNKITSRKVSPQRTIQPRPEEMQQTSLKNAALTMDDLKSELQSIPPHVRDAIVDARRPSDGSRDSSERRGGYRRDEAGRRDSSRQRQEDDSHDRESRRPSRERSNSRDRAREHDRRERRERERDYPSRDRKRSSVESDGGWTQDSRDRRHSGTSSREQKSSRERGGRGETLLERRHSGRGEDHRQQQQRYVMHIRTGSSYDHQDSEEEEQQRLHSSSRRGSNQSSSHGGGAERRRQHAEEHDLDYPMNVRELMDSHSDSDLDRRSPVELRQRSHSSDCAGARTRAHAEERWRAQDNRRDVAGSRAERARIEPSRRGRSIGDGEEQRDERGDYERRYPSVPRENRREHIKPAVPVQQHRSREPSANRERTERSKSATDAHRVREGSQPRGGWRVYDEILREDEDRGRGYGSPSRDQQERKDALEWSRKNAWDRRMGAEHYAISPIHAARSSTPQGHVLKYKYRAFDGSQEPEKMMSAEFQRSGEFKGSLSASEMNDLSRRRAISASRIPVRKSTIVSESEQPNSQIARKPSVPSSKAMPKMKSQGPSFFEFKCKKGTGASQSSNAPMAREEDYRRGQQQQQHKQSMQQAAMADPRAKQSGDMLSRYRRSRGIPDEDLPAAPVQKQQRTSEAPKRSGSFNKIPPFNGFKMPPSKPQQPGQREMQRGVRQQHQQEPQYITPHQRTHTGGQQQQGRQQMITHLEDISSIEGTSSRNRMRLHSSASLDTSDLHLEAGADMTDIAEWKRLTDWLKQIGMEAYFGSLRHNGVTKLSIMELLQRDDLLQIGFADRDIPVVLRHIQDFSRRTRSFSEQVLTESPTSLSNRMHEEQRQFSQQQHNAHINSSSNIPVRKPAAEAAKQSNARVATNNTMTQASLIQHHRQQRTAGTQSSPTMNLSKSYVEQAHMMPSTEERHHHQQQQHAHSQHPEKLLSSKSDIRQELLESFDLGDQYRFFHAWRNAALFMPDDFVQLNAERPSLFNTRQAMEFHLHLHFATFPIKNSQDRNAIRRGKDALKKYLENILLNAELAQSSNSPGAIYMSISTQHALTQLTSNADGGNHGSSNSNPPPSPSLATSFTRSREFAKYAGIVMVPEPQENVAFADLFKADWIVALKNRLVQFLDLVNLAADKEGELPAAGAAAAGAATVDVASLQAPLPPPAQNLFETPPKQQQQQQQQKPSPERRDASPAEKRKPSPTRKPSPQKADNRETTVPAARHDAAKKHEVDVHQQGGERRHSHKQLSDSLEHAQDDIERNRFAAMNSLVSPLSPESIASSISQLTDEDGILGKHPHLVPETHTTRVALNQLHYEQQRGHQATAPPSQQQQQHSKSSSKLFSKSLMQSQVDSYHKLLNRSKHANKPAEGAEHHKQDDHEAWVESSDREAAVEHAADAPPPPQHGSSPSSSGEKKKIAPLPLGANIRTKSSSKMMQAQVNAYNKLLKLKSSSNMQLQQQGAAAEIQQSDDQIKETAPPASAATVEKEPAAVVADDAVKDRNGERARQESALEAMMKTIDTYAMKDETAPAADGAPLGSAEEASPRQTEERE